MENKTLLTFGIFLVTLIFLSSNILAFAVSSQYSNKFPLEMYAGETKDIIIVLQNMPGPEDIVAKGKITQGQEIASIIGGEKKYDIPLGGKTEVKIRIVIPEEAILEDEYKVILTFSPIPEEEGGTLGFGSAIEKELPIKIITEPEEPKAGGMTGKAVLGLSSTVSYTSLAILIVIIIIVIIIVKKKKPQNEGMIKNSKKTKQI